MTVGLLFFRSGTVSTADFDNLRTAEINTPSFKVLPRLIKDFIHVFVLTSNIFLSVASLHVLFFLLIVNRSDNVAIRFYTKTTSRFHYV